MTRENIIHQKSLLFRFNWTGCHAKQFSVKHEHLLAERAAITCLKRHL